MQSGNASSAGHAWRKQTRKMQNGCVNNLDELPAEPGCVFCIFLVYVSLKNTYSEKKGDEAGHCNSGERAENVPFANCKQTGGPVSRDTYIYTHTIVCSFVLSWNVREMQ